MWASSELARSYLFVPGDNERLLGKVMTSGADAVVLDLEDAVAPERKDAARELVRRTLRETPYGVAVWVRINSLQGHDWRGDVAAVVVPGIAGLRVPKTESAEDVAELHWELFRAEGAAGIEPGSLRVTCTIESAVGLLEARRLAGHPRVSHLAFGEADFTADVGADPSDPTATLWARSSLVVAARAAGIAAPIAPVYTRLDDEEGLRRTSAEARRLGFFGRSAIHPKQLAAIHEVFTPSPEEIAAARRVVQAFDGGAGKVGGRFLDAAVARRAHAVLELAAALAEEER